MRIKTATRLGLIGAIINIAVIVFHILLTLDVINLGNAEDDLEKYIRINTIASAILYLCSLFSAFSLAVFFYTLHKNQK